MAPDGEMYRLPLQGIGLQPALPTAAAGTALKWPGQIKGDPAGKDNTVFPHAKALLKKVFELCCRFESDDILE